MLLKGSCSCGAVHFEVRTRHPYPYQLCYCSICRKTAGSGGYAINLKAEAATLKVRGKRNLKVYRARIRNPEDRRATQSPGERNFCGKCGSALWLYDPRWPDLLHPFAGAIDSPLPVPPERTHLMLDFKPKWVPVAAGAKDRRHRRYPKEWMSQWHERMGLEVDL
ncbi:MAG TPA: GFA family protein [bacterium]